MLTSKTWATGSKAAEYYLSDEATDQIGPALWVGKGRQYYPDIPDEVDAEMLVQLADYSGDYSTQRKAVVDLTFTAPKPVSIYAALTDERQREQLIAVQIDAVRKALDRVESDYALAKMSLSTANHLMETIDRRLRVVRPRTASRGKGKKESSAKDPDKEQVYLRTHNLLAALCTHFCTRPVEGEPDPNLHTHCVIPRITSRPDKESVTLYLDVDTRARDVNGPYLDHMLEGLRRLGIPAQRSGTLDIAIDGIPPELIDAFSLRSKKITATAEALQPAEYRNPTPTEKRLAAIFTREPKGAVSWQERLPGWRRRALAATVGAEIESLQGLLSDETTQRLWQQFWEIQEQNQQRMATQTAKPSPFTGSG